jgi:hypothetical protein
MSEVQHRVEKFTAIEKRRPYAADGKTLLSKRLFIGIRWVGYGASDDSFHELSNYIKSPEWVAELLEYHAAGGKGLPKA